MKRLFLLFILFLLSVSFVSAYYADVRIVVDETGVVSIEGITNHPSLLIEDSSDFTSKNGKFWLLNISVDGVFEDLAYEINLPKGAVINYMKLPDFGRLEDKNGLQVTGATQDSSLEFTLQYAVRQYSPPSFSWFIIFVAVLVGVSIYAFLVLKKKKPSIDFSKYSSRQKTILKLIAKHDGEITQAKLERLTGLPKSSLSRNIDSLVRKDVVEKFNKGMSNTIRLLSPKK